jgi:RND superfamily putative drug exporter
MGRWSAQHRKKAIFGWLAFVIVSFVIGGALGTKAPEDEQTYVGESGKAHQLVDQHFPTQNVESIIIKGRGGAEDPAVKSAVDDTIAAVTGKPGVYAVESPYTKGNKSQISADGKSVLVNFKLRGDETQAEDSVGAVLTAVDGVQKANPRVFVGEFGGASASQALSKAFEDDFKKAETLSLPITLIILVLAFGALVAAGVPLLLGLSAVMAALGLVALPSQIVPLGENTASIILLVGLAVGVDYTLFYLRREREERARGAGHREAIHTAAATSGRAVLISGLTVMVAMAGMFLAGDQTFTALGVGAITVVLVAMIGSVTVVPAFLSVLGDRVEKGRVPFLHRRRSAGGESRIWSAILDVVLRRPKVSAIAATAVLLALASPALGMKAVLSGTDDLPRSLAVMQVYDEIDASFPGGQIPAMVTTAGICPPGNAASILS